MTANNVAPRHGAHDHVFLGSGHEMNERKTWAVIAICTLMMVVEVGGGTLFGSLALVADGLHMATHALAILIAALAYRFARLHVSDIRFTFGTGKVGDLAGFTSAVILAMIALLVGYEAVSRLFQPVAIRFAEALPIAVLGLGVNVLSAWLLSGPSDHSHGHEHSHGSAAITDVFRESDRRSFLSRAGDGVLEIFEVNASARFRVHFTDNATRVNPPRVRVETRRNDGGRQVFEMRPESGFLESIERIAEPHEFVAVVCIDSDPPVFESGFAFSDSAHLDSYPINQDHNFRSAFVHVVGDAAVSVLAILGLLAARYLSWVWMDPVMGLVGAAVIAAWAYALVRDTTRILVDMAPDPALDNRIRRQVEANGDLVSDLHLWRLGPGHLGAIVSVVTSSGRSPEFYKSHVHSLGHLSHVTVEVLTVPGDSRS